MNSRLQKIREQMNHQQLDAILISSNPNIIYLTDFNHFTIEEREAYLLITKENAYILTDRRYTHAVQTHVKDFILLEIFYGHRFVDWVKEISEKEGIKTLGVEEDNLTYQEYKTIAPFVSEFKHFDLSFLRIIKTTEEIQAIQKACAVGDEVFANILSKLKPGITEQELALEMEIAIKHYGAELAFATIVAFDENAAFIHHKTGNKKLGKQATILFDFGVKYNNYCSDMARTVFLGKASPEQKKAYFAVSDAQDLAVKFLEEKLAANEEIKAADVDRVARDYVIAQGFETFPHGLGHGVGLEVHELPFVRPPSKDTLKSGMTFSNEPGVYVNNKFGIRIEDILAIQDNKVMQLTKASRELIEL